MWLLNKSLPGSTHCVVIGHVKEGDLLKEVREHKKVLWIIEDKEGKALQTQTHSEKLETFLLNSKEDLERATQEVGHWITLNPIALPSLKISDEVLSNSALYEPLLDSILILFDERQRVRNAQRTQGYWVQKRLFKNLPWMLQAMLPQTLKGQARGHAAVVVGAGPSLDVTLPLIARWKFRPLIIASDTALSALQAFNIEADFVVNIDPLKTCEKCKIDRKSGWGIFTSDCHSSFLELWGKDAFCLAKGELFERWLGRKNWPCVLFENCSHAGLTGILLADFLGVEGIVLVGMDLAFERQRYAKLVKRKVVVRNNTFVQIPGNYVAKVATTLPGDWKTACTACSQIAGHASIINFNDRGARIDGAHLMHPDKNSELETLLSGHLDPFSPNESTFKKIRSGQTPLAMLRNTLLDVYEKEKVFFEKLRSMPVEVKLEALHSWILERNSEEGRPLEIFGSHVYNLMTLLVDEKQRDKDKSMALERWLQEMEVLLLELAISLEKLAYATNF